MEPNKEEKDNAMEEQTNPNEELSNEQKLERLTKMIQEVEQELGEQYE